MKYSNHNSIVLFLLFSVFTLACCRNKKIEHPKDNFSVTTTFGGSYKIDTSEFVYIVGKLHNHSTDTLSFLSMLCSWEVSWKINSANLRIENNICYLNVPILIKLAPNESMVNYIPVRLLKPLNEIMNEKFQVGFNLVPADRLDFSQSMETLEKSNNYFWGDTLQLNMLNRFNTIKKEK